MYGVNEIGPVITETTQLKTDSLSRALVWAVLLGALGSAWGCAGSTVWELDNTLPFPQVPGRARSIALDSPALRGHTLFANDDDMSTVVPWYATRNDASRATFAGYTGAVLDQTVNITVDRQVIAGGRSRDHVSSTTYRRQVTETFR